MIEHLWLFRIVSTACRIYTVYGLLFTKRSSFNNSTVNGNSHGVRILYVLSTRSVPFVISLLTCIYVYRLYLSSFIDSIAPLGLTQQHQSGTIATHCNCYFELNTIIVCKEDNAVRSCTQELECTYMK